MVYAILSDVHANLDALDRVLADAARHGADDCVCLGDLVGYGPLPRETLARIRTRCRTVLAGNHDDAVSGRGDASLFIDLAADAVARHKAALDAEALAWLRTLPYTATIAGAACAHGDFSDPARFHYIENEADAKANFARLTTPLAFVGHTHEPAIFLTGRSGAVYRLAPQDFVLEEGKRYIVNLGSVGYPREANGKCLSSYVLYDTDARTVSFRFLPFAVSSVMQRGQAPARRRGIAAWLIVPLLVLAALAFILVPRSETPPVAPSETAATASETKVLRTIRLPLDGKAKAVRANLTLAKDSAPATMTLLFLGEGGKVLGRQSETVTRKSTKKTSIPPGARLADLSVTSLDPDKEATIDTFTPAAE